MVPEKRRFVAIARVVRPQGRRGEVLCQITTDFPDRFQKLDRIFLGTQDGLDGSESEPRLYPLERAWPHKGRMVLKLAGIDSISQAESLRGLLALVPFEERLPLAENTYYLPDLEGCRVMKGPVESRIEIGIVTAVEPTGGVPILRVERARPERDEVLIPFAQEICRVIDTAAKIIVIDPPEDLLELNETSSRRFVNRVKANPV